MASHHRHDARETLRTDEPGGPAAWTALSSRTKLAPGEAGSTAGARPASSHETKGRSVRLCTVRRWPQTLAVAARIVALAAAAAPGDAMADGPADIRQPGQLTVGVADAQPPTANHAERR